MNAIADAYRTDDPVSHVLPNRLDGVPLRKANARARFFFRDLYAPLHDSAENGFDREREMRIQ